MLDIDGDDYTISVTRRKPLFSVEATWLSSGVVLILSYPLLSTCRILKQYDLPSDEKAIRVRLAPFGWSGLIFPKDDKKSGARSLDPAELKPEDELSTSEWRNLVLDVLERQGISIPQNVDGIKWVRIVLDEARLAVVQGRSDLSWPESLCYEFDSYGRLPQKTKEIIEIDDVTDLLSEAETWYTERDMRKNAIEAQLRELRNLEQSRSTSSSDDDEEIASLFPRSDEILDQEIVSGIYPTPPEGSKPHTGPAMTARGGSIGDRDTQIRLAKNNHGKPSIMDDIPTSLDINMDLGSYDHMEDTDFFGDMEGGIYNDNGITEDDFNFFDEPGDNRQSGESMQSRINLTKGEHKSRAPGNADSKLQNSKSLADASLGTNAADPLKDAPSVLSAANELEGENKHQDGDSLVLGILETPNSGGPQADISGAVFAKTRDVELQEIVR